MATAITWDRRASAWRYDEPPRDGTLILGFFLPEKYESYSDIQTCGGVSLAFWNSKGWEYPGESFGGSTLSDCRLLCWHPIDWEV